MTNVATVRTVAWLVMLVGAGMFLLRLRSAPNDVATGLQLAVATLPFQVATIAMLVLFWVGPFPPSWPLVGDARRGVIFWVALALWSLFWVFFYIVFVLGS